MDFIMTVTMKQYQIGVGVVVMVVISVVNFKVAFCHKV